MARYTIRETATGVRVNTIEWDGVRPIQLPPGTEVVPHDPSPPTTAEIDRAKDCVYDAADVVSMRVLYRHENLIRQLIRALRASSSAANTAANNAGLPASTAAADLSPAEFRAAIKSLLD